MAPSVRDALLTWVLSLHLGTHFLRPFTPQKDEPLPLHCPELFTNKYRVGQVSPLGRGADLGFMGWAQGGCWPHRVGWERAHAEQHPAYAAPFLGV